MVLLEVYEYIYVNCDYGLDRVECEVKWSYDAYAWYTVWRLESVSWRYYVKFIYNMNIKYDRVWIMTNVYDNF